MSAIESVLAEVAAELDWLTPPPVFIGGATIGLFLDEFARTQLRPTKDVDCIVPAITTTMQWFELERQLRHQGWQPDPRGPICRYFSPRGHMVDLLALRPEAQGFAGAWFASAVTHSEERVVYSRSVRIPDAAHLLACKLEAFKDRGMQDPYVSTDFEDIVSLLDGCVQLENVLAVAPLELRRFVMNALRTIWLNPHLLAVAEGHLPRGGDTAGRLRRLRARLKALSELSVVG